MFSKLDFKNSDNKEAINYEIKNPSIKILGFTSVCVFGILIIFFEMISEGSGEGKVFLSFITTFIVFPIYFFIALSNFSTLIIRRNNLDFIDKTISILNLIFIICSVFIVLSLFK